MAEDSRVGGEQRKRLKPKQADTCRSAQQPVISVIMPCYNAEATLLQAVDSALVQADDVPLEIITVDDCSTDGTSDMLARLEEEGKVVLLSNTSSLGAGGSRNRAVRAARGSYVAFLDADDAWAPGKLRMQLAAIRERGSVLCCTARELMMPDGKLTGRVIHVGETITYRQLLRHNSINCSSVVLEREAALRYPMEHEDSHEDYITWLKILRECGPAVGIDLPLLQYRLSAAGKSGSKLHSAAMTFKVYRYMGFGPCQSAACFVSYALHGLWKYLTSYLSGRAKNKEKT